jgi:hypothetical protein
MNTPFTHNAQEQRELWKRLRETFKILSEILEPKIAQLNMIFKCKTEQLGLEITSDFVNTPGVYITLKNYQGYKVPVINMSSQKGDTAILEITYRKKILKSDFNMPDYKNIFVHNYYLKISEPQNFVWQESESNIEYSYEKLADNIVHYLRTGSIRK